MRARLHGLWSRRRGNRARAGCRSRDMTLPGHGAALLQHLQRVEERGRLLSRAQSNIEIEALEPREFWRRLTGVLVIGWSPGRVKSTGRMFDNPLGDGLQGSRQQDCRVRGVRRCTSARRCPRRRLPPCFRLLSTRGRLNMWSGILRAEAWDEFCPANRM